MKAARFLLWILDIAIKVILAVLVLNLLYRGAMLGYSYGYRIFTEPAVSSGSGRNVSVTITEEMSAKDIANLFYEKGLTEDSFLFFLQYYCSEYREDLVPGTYTLSTTMTAEEMFEAMTLTEDEDS